MTSSAHPVEARTVGGPGGWASHLRIGLAALVITVIAGGLALHALARAAEAPGQSGPVLAWFPPSWAPSAILFATAEADGLLRAEGRLPGLVEVAGDRPGLAGRLRAAGAWLVLAPLPMDLMTLGGCAGTVPLRAADRRPRTVL